jgi:hypothetical protein
MNPPIWEEIQSCTKYTADFDKNIINILRYDKLKNTSKLTDNWCNEIVKNSPE